jgi:hypothetical protein
MIMAVDIEGSTARTNPAKARLREAMYDIVEKALDSGGVAEHRRDPFIDRGDGLLALIHPADDVPKTVLLDPVIPTLRDLLRGQGFRLRAVLHAGEVHYDARGCFGEALDIASRLLDSANLKRRLHGTTEPLVLAVSDDIYFSVVRHSYDGIDNRDFAPAVRVRVAGRTHRGWVHPNAA